MRICDQYKKQKQNYMDKTIKKMIIKIRICVWFYYQIFIYLF